MVTIYGTIVMVFLTHIHWKDPRTREDTCGQPAAILQYIYKRNGYYMWYGALKAKIEADELKVVGVLSLLAKLMK